MLSVSFVEASAMSAVGQEETARLFARASQDRPLPSFTIGSFTVGFMAENGRAKSPTETVGRFSCAKAAK
jgi:hypothetical protein